MYQQYDQAVQTVLEWMVRLGFSRSPRMAFREATRAFKTYLVGLNLEYSQAHAQRWLIGTQLQVQRKKFLARRRALALVDQVLTHETIKQTRFYYADRRTRYMMSDCFRHDLESYLSRRREDGCQTSTLAMDRNACSRLLVFLYANGITDMAQITPGILKTYCSQTEHRTAAGKNAYIRRARGFLRYLASVGRVPESLGRALPTEKAPSVTIVKRLSCEQIYTVERYRETARSRVELRNAAMTLLALRLGLRSVDICNLQLSDISWTSRTIRVVQRKTGKPLTLPFPITVGNALARYITCGRPACDTPYVFISLNRPYRRVSRGSACYGSSISILGKRESPADTRGLHIMRKTYASRLLVARNPVSLIAVALGHCNDTSVHQYLATDENRIRECAIGLTGIAPTGVLQ